MSLAQLLAEITGKLAAAGVPEPRRDAQLILGAALKTDRAGIIGHPDRRLTATERGRVGHLAARRARREPMAYLIGHREFWGIDFVVGATTLVPRPDSETLIEAALELGPDRARASRVLDLGTGTGCLLVALLKEHPSANGIGVDRSLDACRIAELNALNSGVGERAAFVVADWGTAFGAEFDVILVNPPYLSENERPALAPEITHFEPKLALFAGADGLSAYRVLASHLYRLLASEGLAFVEIGHDQRSAVSQILGGARLTVRECRRDLGGWDRCLVVSRPPRSSLRLANSSEKKQLKTWQS